MAELNPGNCTCQKYRGLFVCVCWCRIGTVTQVSWIPSTNLCEAFSQIRLILLLCAAFPNFANVKNGTKGNV